MCSLICCCLQGVWYNAHRPRDGTWVPAEKVELEAGRPVAYVAKHGHGTYPKVIGCSPCCSESCRWQRTALDAALRQRWNTLSSE